MNILHPFATLPPWAAITSTKPLSHNNHFSKFSMAPLLLPIYSRTGTWTFSCSAKSRREDLNGKDFNIDLIREDREFADDEESGINDTRETKDVDLDGDDVGGYSFRGPYSSRQEKDYDRDPEYAEILGSVLDNPQKAQSKIEDRLRKKRTKILHTKTGSGKPMKVSVNKFDFSNTYIWFEFYNAPLAKDISLICDTIRAWHIVGRLGGCNSMNMQLSQSPMDKRPSYDFIQGANVTPTTFYNIGDLEVQDNLARIWVDIGTSEPLLLDVLINALTQISSDFVGIKQVTFGGEEFENWKESMTSEDSGFSVHKI